MKFSYVLSDPMSYAKWEDFVAHLATMKRLGYEAVELQIADPTELDERRLRQALDEVRYHLCAVQTGATYYSRGNCLCTADVAVRRRTVELLKSFVNFAQRFGSIIVFGSLQGRANDEPDLAAGCARVNKAMREVGQYATTKNVVVAYEPLNHIETAYYNTIDEVAAFVRAVGLPGLKMMIDTFHMNIEEKSMVDDLSKIKDICKHVHLSETNRDILGLGHWETLSFLQALDKTGYTGYCSVGVYHTTRTPKESMQACMEVLHTLR
jgi:sugar phosphate isomerase/epimerase